MPVASAMRSALPRRALSARSRFMKTDPAGYHRCRTPSNRSIRPANTEHQRTPVQGRIGRGVLAALEQAGQGVLEVLEGALHAQLGQDAAILPETPRSGPNRLRP